MFRQAENKVKIEGILAETDLKYSSFQRDGVDTEAIGGSIKVLVNQQINGVETTLEVPVYMFSTKYTKAGKLNPAYESIERVMKEFISIAACGSMEQADKIRITNASIRMNEFVGQNGQMVSQPRVNASFVSKATGDFAPCATFTIEFMASNIARAVDRDGVELDPPRLNVQGIVPQYTAPNADVMNVDLVPMIATSPNVINAIEGYWNVGECFKASGRLNFSSRTEEVIDEVDFGEPQKSYRTINVSEFIITGGSQAPLDGDLAWSYEDIKAAMAARKVRLEERKAAPAVKKTPVQHGSKGSLDLGF